MRRSGAAVCLLVLVVLAGCNAVGEEGVTETVTPVRVSESTGSAAAVAGETPDTRLLLRTHADTARATNYTIRIEQRTLGPDGQQLRESVRYRAVARGGNEYWGYRRAEVELETLREYGTTDYWTNGSHVATRYNSPLRPVQTRIWTSEDGPLATPSNSQQFRRLLRAASPTVSNRTADDSAVLVGTRRGEVTQLDTPPNLDNPHNLTVRLRVRPSGLIDRWQVRYRATLAGESVQVVRTGEVAGTGVTTVGRPDWVANATQVSEQEAPASPYTQLPTSKWSG